VTPTPEDGDDDGEADRHLGGGDRDHHHREGVTAEVTVHAHERPVERVGIAREILLHAQAGADRDQHLRSADFFDVARYPQITFRSTRIAPAGNDTFLITGQLTMRGVTKEITLPVTYAGDVRDPWGNTKAGFSTETTLDRKDFGMVWNAALDQGGVLLGDQVKISINLEAKLEQPAPQPAP